MERQIEKNERTPLEELQFKYADKLIDSLNLEIDIGYSTTEQCASQLEWELEKTGYCPEVRRYIQFKLDGMIDDTADNEIDAYLRRVEFKLEMYARGITDFTHLSPEDHPDYPKLEQLWEEVRVLKRQMEAAWET